MRRSLLLLNVLLIIATASALTFQLARATTMVTYYPGPYVDWQTYENTVDRLFAGAGIYAPEQLAGPYLLTDMVRIGYAYPPASVPLFIPFQGYPFGLAAWMTLNLGLLLTGIWAIVSRAWPARRIPAMCLVVMGLTAFFPFLGGFVALNFNIGIAGVVGWIARGVDWRFAGIAGGLSGIVKVFPGVLALGAAQGKLRSVLLAIAIGAVLIAATIPVVGYQSWLDFVRALTSASPDCTGFNSSIACFLGPSVGAGVGSLVGVAIGGSAAIAMAFVRSPYWLAVLAAIGIMAPANNLHLHYWTIGYVLLVATAGELALARRGRLTTTTQHQFA